MYRKAPKGASAKGSPGADQSFCGKRGSQEVPTGLPVAIRERKRKSGRQCEKKGSGGKRVRPPRAPARPTGFRGLREVRKPRPRAPPLPHLAPLFTLVPPRALSEPPGFSFLPPPHPPSRGTRFPHAFRGVNSPAAETRGLSPWPSGLLVTGDPTGSRFLRAAHRETGSEATTRKGRSANTAALRGELLEVFLLPGVHCGRNRGEKHHREERV